METHEKQRPKAQQLLGGHQYLRGILGVLKNEKSTTLESRFYLAKRHAYMGSRAHVLHCRTENCALNNQIPIDNKKHPNPNTSANALNFSTKLSFEEILFIQIFYCKAIK